MNLHKARQGQSQIQSRLEWLQHPCNLASFCISLTTREGYSLVTFSSTASSSPLPDLLWTSIFFLFGGDLMLASPHLISLPIMAIPSESRFLRHPSSPRDLARTALGCRPTPHPCCSEGPADPRTAQIFLACTCTS